MNAETMVTLTLGDQAENHAGMEKLGELVKEGEGFTLEDLRAMKRKFKGIGVACDLFSLALCEVECRVELTSPPDAYVLVIRGGVTALLQQGSGYTQSDMFKEHIGLNVDKQAWMRGRVVNKHARWNLCFDDESREPDYEHKRGRIVGYDEIPVTKQLLSGLSQYFGPKSTGLKGEGNYYYDTTKCGIGFHGDSERRKVIGKLF